MANQRVRKGTLRTSHFQQVLEPYRMMKDELLRFARPGRGSTLLVFGLCFLLPVFRGPHACAQTIQATYDIFMKKDKVGTQDIRRTRTKHREQPAVRIETTVSIRVKFFVFKYSLDAKESGVLGADGLLAYFADATEDGKKTHVQGRLRDDVLAMDLREGKKSRHLDFRTSAFDATSLDLVENKIQKGTPARQFKILNLDVLAIEDQTRAYVGEKSHRVGEKTFACRAISFKGPGASGERWIAEDDQGPFLVKETGTDKDGPYSVILTSYTKR